MIRNRGRRCLSKSRFRAALALLVAATAAIPATAGAFKEHWHKAVTYAALSFLDDSVLKQMLAVHDDLDNPKHWKTAGVDRWHFNDCDFQGATENVRALYETATGRGKRARPEVDWVAFGKMLHTVQDFYAHTSWVDLKETSLVDARLDEWTIIKPYQAVSPNLVAVAGTERGFSVRRDKKGEPTVTVTRPDGTTTRGLISGAAFIQKQCPKNVEIGHWDGPDEQFGLAKDHPCRGDGFWRACTLALRQTLNEWCRLLELEERYYPGQGREAVLQSVRSREARQEAEEVCRTRAYLQPNFEGGCSCGG
jgi:hypothetical protein